MTTMLEQAQHKASEHDFASLAPTVMRASTVVFKSIEDFVSRKKRLPDGFTYGTTGTPTQRALERRISELDNANHCVVFPSGQAAICATLLALLKQGDHLLMTESSYGPAKTFALQKLAQFGIEVDFYNPDITENIAALIKPNTRLIWLESPGTITMEVQDVPAIVAVAKKNSILTAIDNTWASPRGLNALDIGVDFCIHACTKYMSGHSDVLMGSVSTRNEQHYIALRSLQANMGLAVSAEDCFLVQRGLETMDLRLSHQGASALSVAESLVQHSAVTKVLFPPLPQSAGHKLWKRDFKNAGSVLSFCLIEAPFEAYSAMFSSFKLFSIGASWGGTHSIAAYYPKEEFDDRRHALVHAPIVRLSIGLEPTHALIEEINTALDCFTKLLSSSAPPTKLKSEVASV